MSHPNAWRRLSLMIPDESDGKAANVLSPDFGGSSRFPLETIMIR
jgi:hypothetical protein